MTRIAWFTPIDSSPRGIPCHRTALLAKLGERYTIDRFIDGLPGLENAPPRTFSAYDFVWKQIRHPYDLTIYDVADSCHYDFVWPYLVRYPGLVILHDERLHRSRSAMLLTRGLDDAYRAEFHYDHPEADPDMAELGVAGLLGETSELWPMRRVVIESSRLAVAPNAWVARTLKTEASHDRLTVVEPGAPKVASSPELRERTRSLHGIDSDAVVFAMFGQLTPDRRVDQVWSALALLRHEQPPLHLLICGEANEMQRDALRRLGITDLVTWPIGAKASDPSEVLAAADVCVALEWPSRRDATTSLIESLAAAKPAIVTDLADRVDIPALDPHDWQLRPLATADDELGDRTAEAACVSIDLLDESHSLCLAMSRLASDPPLREKLSRGARHLWENRFSFDRLAREFAEVIQHALETPLSDVRPPLLDHLRADGTTHAKALLSPFGIAPSGLPDLAPASAHEGLSEP